MFPVFLAILKLCTIQKLFNYVYTSYPFWNLDIKSEWDEETEMYVEIEAWCSMSRDEYKIEIWWLEAIEYQTSHSQRGIMQQVGFMQLLA